MRFLADMGVSLKVVQWLREEGHDVTHLRDEGLQRLPNGDIFRKAIGEKRVVLTFDLDFGEIAALSKKETVSVIVFRLHNTSAANVISRLTDILEHSTPVIQQGAIVIAEESRYRVRHLPIG